MASRATPGVSAGEAAQRIKQRALDLGFDAAGVAGVTALEAHAHFEAWLAAGRNGEMRYLASAKHRERRAHPERILRDVRSVVCVALCHEPGRDAERDQRIGRIARYAAGEDYHRIMRDKLRALERWIEEELLPARAPSGTRTPAPFSSAAGPSAPVWAGSASTPACCRSGSARGSCSARSSSTMSSSPTHRCPASTAGAAGAASTPARPARSLRLPARRAAVHLLPDHRAPRLHSARAAPAIGDWVFGCDICQEVCPWNRFAPAAREARLHARTLDGWTLERFLTLDDAGFTALFGGSPILRAGRPGFLRNVCVALGNRAHEHSAPPCSPR
jgi:epoxyqueuosine reductase